MRSRRSSGSWGLLLMRMVSRGSRSFPGPHPVTSSGMSFERVSLGFETSVMSILRSGSSTRRGATPIIVMRFPRRSVASGPTNSTFRPLVSSGSVPDNWHAGTCPQTAHIQGGVTDRSLLLSRRSQGMRISTTLEPKGGQLIAEFVKKETS